MQYIVNGQHVFESEDLTQGKILDQQGNECRFLYKEKIYDIKILDWDTTEKAHTVKINGFTVTIKQHSPLDILISQLGFDKPPKREIKEIVAPMPGLVKEIFVQVGTEINEGDNLFILEAMKMENIIKSSGQGTIAEIVVVEGEKVEKGAILAKL